MAQKVSVQLIDDLDGSEAIESVAFTLDGNHYEIDLSADNLNALRNALTPYVEAARKVTRSTRGARKASASGVDTKAVREWARSQGIKVSDRGRIPSDIIDQYNTRTVDSATAKKPAKKAAKKDESAESTEPATADAS